MNPDTIQFQCGFCRTTLTVPAQMAGVSGPCPSCGQTVTSPSAPPPAAPAPQWTQPPAAAPQPSWPPSPLAPMSGDPTVPGMGIPPPQANTGLPPRRAPGQPPLTTSINAPANLMPWASSPGAPAAINSPASSADLPVGMPGGGIPNQSRLIPGSPPLANMAQMGNAGGGMLGMPSTLPAGSLLGREVSAVPLPAMTQPLQANGTPPLSLGGGMHPDAQPAAPMAPIPPGRSIASLRSPRGTNFIRLAFAALFLLGFLGLVGFLLKDYIPGLIPSLTGHDATEESAKSASTLTPSIPSASSPPTAAPSKPTEAPADKTSVLTASTGENKAPSSSITVGFDPKEPVASIPKPASEADSAGASASSLSSAPTVTGTAMANATTTTPSTAPPGALLEVPPSPAPNAAAANNPASMPSGLGEVHAIEEEGVPPPARPAVDAIKKFLAARNLNERLQHTLGADLMKPLMERYYSRSPDGAITVDRIQFVRMDPNPELGTGRHCILSLENKTWEFPVPVMLEEKDDGFKVDWIAFVEFKDRMLEKFFQSYQEGKARFHVGIIRHHYFEDGVPNLDRKDVFRISPAPPNSFQASVFLDKDSPLAIDLRTMLPWETHVWAVVELEWKKLGSQQWVELSAVPQMHWYSLPMTASKSVSTPQKAVPVEEDIPPGITKNGKRGKSAEIKPAETPPGIRKSTPDLPPTIKRPLPAGR